MAWMATAMGSPASRCRRRTSWFPPQLAVSSSPEAWLWQLLRCSRPAPVMPSRRNDTSSGTGSTTRGWSTCIRRQPNPGATPCSISMLRGSMRNTYPVRIGQPDSLSPITSPIDRLRLSAPMGTVATTGGGTTTCPGSASGSGSPASWARFLTSGLRSGSSTVDHTTTPLRSIASMDRRGHGSGESKSASSPLHPSRVNSRYDPTARHSVDCSRGDPVLRNRGIGGCSGHRRAR